MTLRWPAATDNVGVVAYDVLRDGTQVKTVTARSAHVQGRGV